MEKRARGNREKIREILSISPRYTQTLSQLIAFRGFFFRFAHFSLLIHFFRVLTFIFITTFFALHSGVCRKNYKLQTHTPNDDKMNKKEIFILFDSRRVNFTMFLVAREIFFGVRSEGRGNCACV